MGVELVVGEGGFVGLEGGDYIWHQNVIVPSCSFPVVTFSVGVLKNQKCPLRRSAFSRGGRSGRARSSAPRHHSHFLIFCS